MVPGIDFGASPPRPADSASSTAHVRITSDALNQSAPLNWTPLIGPPRASRRSRQPTCRTQIGGAAVRRHPEAARIIVVRRAACEGGVREASLALNNALLAMYPTAVRAGAAIGRLGTRRTWPRPPPRSAPGRGHVSPARLGQPQPSGRLRGSPGLAVVCYRVKRK